MDQELNQEVEIDLLSLVKVLLRKWWLIAIATALGVFVTGAYAFVMLDDVYTAESSMIVQVQSNTDSDYTNLITGERLANTYKEIAKSNTVLTTVRENLDLDYTNEQLGGMITVTSVTSTLIVKLEVNNTDPELASDIANEVVSAVQLLADEFDGLENVEVLDVATVPVNPSGPNRVLYLAVGILLGGMAGVGIVLAIEYLDKNIKKGKDVERFLGLRLLGTIPEYNMDEEVVE
jgi:capsular polysaccharide biosynthesis protein